MSKIDIFKSLRLLVRPALIALVFLSAWTLIHYNFPIPDIETQWAAGILAGTYGLHALFAGFSINRISDKHDVIAQADALGDKDMFMFMRERHALDTPWRILLMMQTVILHVLFLLAPFAAFGWGTIFILGGSLSVFVFWEVAVELDDPFSGIWRDLHLYHREWKDENVIEYFLKKNKKTQETLAV